MQVTATFLGVSPLLMNRFPLEPIRGREKLPPREQAELCLYRATDGLLCIPAMAIRACLISAARYSKWRGRQTLQTPIAAVLEVLPDAVPLRPIPIEWDIDSRAVVNPTTGGRIVSHRARIPLPWAITFDLRFDSTLVTEAQLKQIALDAGMRVGLLDYRPERRGPFGRFSLSQWEITHG